MKKVLLWFVMSIVLILTGCFYPLGSESNENVGPKETEPFDFKQAIADIETERQEMYFPVLNKSVFFPIREYVYNVQEKYLEVKSKYDLDERDDTVLSSNVFLSSYKPRNNKELKQLGKGLRRKKKIDINGFTGFYGKKGAKLNTTYLELKKEDYRYSYLPSDRMPMGSDNFPEVEITRLEEADYFEEEWKRLKDKLINRVQLPDLTGKHISSIDFIINYDQTDAYKMRVNVGKDDYTFYRYTARTKESINEIFIRELDEEAFDETLLNLSDDREVTRFKYNRVNTDRNKVVVKYRWEEDGLIYQIEVVDPDYFPLNQDDTAEQKYINIIESVLTDERAESR